MQYNLGRVVPLFKGDYSETQNYEVLDVVLYKGSSYVAKLDTVGNNPTDPTYWQLVASAGEGGGVATTIDSELSTTSENPVQNKVITLKINDLESIIVPEETVRQIVEGYGYQNESQVNSSIEAKGYETTTNVDEKLKPYAKKTDIATINGQTITGGGNITIEGGSGGTTPEQVQQIIDSNKFTDKGVAYLENDPQYGGSWGIITGVEEYGSYTLDYSKFVGTSDHIDLKEAPVQNCRIYIKNTITDVIYVKGFNGLTYNAAWCYRDHSYIYVKSNGLSYMMEISDQVSKPISEASVNQLIDSNVDTKLESYTPTANIKTINGQSITDGPGDITIESGGASVTVDSQMSLDSENPVQNKVITTRINEVEGKIPTSTSVDTIQYTFNWDGGGYIGFPIDHDPVQGGSYNFVFPSDFRDKKVTLIFLTNVDFTMTFTVPDTVNIDYFDPIVGPKDFIPGHTYRITCDKFKVYSEEYRANMGVDFSNNFTDIELVKHPENWEHWYAFNESDVSEWGSYNMKMTNVTESNVEIFLDVPSWVQNVRIFMDINGTNSVYVGGFSFGSVKINPGERILVVKKDDYCTLSYETVKGGGGGIDENRANQIAEEVSGRRINNQPSETWEFTLEDDSTIQKNVVLK